MLRFLAFQVEFASMLDVDSLGFNVKVVSTSAIIYLTLIVLQFRDTCFKVLCFVRYLKISPILLIFYLGWLSRENFQASNPFY